MFQRIVVALDSSEPAQEALSIAITLAQTTRGEIGICSVVDPIVVSGTAPPSAGMEIVVRDMETEAHRLIDDAVERAHRAAVRAHGETRCGAPAFELLQYAKRFGADVIVTGTHGRRGLKHLLMGSVAEVILREATVPVLVVRAARSAHDEQRADHAEHGKHAEHRGGRPAATT